MDDLSGLRSAGIHKCISHKQ